MPIVHTMPLVLWDNAKYAYNAIYAIHTMPNVQTMPFLQHTQCQLCIQCHLCTQCHFYLVSNAKCAHNATCVAYLALDGCIFGIGWLHIWHWLIVNYCSIYVYTDYFTKHIYTAVGCQISFHFEIRWQDSVLSPLNNVLILLHCHKSLTVSDELAHISDHMGHLRQDNIFNRPRFNFGMNNLLVILEIKSFGESYPIIETKSIQHNVKNRRIEFEVIK